jgi:CheY-like chemotaxis protein/PAS domain-containing protein
MVEVWNEYVVSLKEQLDQINETLALSKSSASDRVSVLKKATEHLRILYKRAEEPAVVPLYDRIASVVGDLDLAVVATDKDGKCTLLNAAADRMFGSDLLKQTSTNQESGFYLADKATHCVKNMPWVSSVDGHEINGAQVFFKRPEFPDGIWLEFNALPIKGFEGTVHGVIAILIDITEQVQVESHIADVRRALEQRLVATANAHTELSVLASKLGKQNWAAESPTATVLAAAAKTAEREERLALVVDDLLVNHALLTSHLSKLGFKAHSANNGVEAVEAASRQDYSLILMDCDMPVMDGYEATKQIRKAEEKSGHTTKIIAMTGYDRLGDREKCLAAGMDEYVAKGIDQTRLFQVIEAVMKGEQFAPEFDASPVDEKELARELDFESLENWYGKDRLHEIISLFLKTSSLLIECLKCAVAERDVRAAHHYAYCIKGPSASLGRVKISNLCEKVASSALHNKWFDADFAYLSLESNFEDLRRSMEKVMACAELANNESASDADGPEFAKIIQLEKRLGKNTALAVADAFLEDTDDALEKIGKCLEKQDDEGLRPLTHRLAGCCASVIDKETQQLTSTLQELARKQSWQAASSLYQTLSESLKTTRMVMQRYLNKAAT